jgi:hypothetical protein
VQVALLHLALLARQERTGALQAALRAQRLLPICLPEVVVVQVASMALLSVCPEQQSEAAARARQGEPRTLRPIWLEVLDRLLDRYRAEQRGLELLVARVAQG